MLIGSFALGCVGLAVGGYLDVLGKWQNWPFLTNVASGAVTALIGLPLAALVAQRLVGAFNDHVERDKVLKNAVEASARLSIAVRDAYDNDLDSMADAVIRLTRRIILSLLPEPAPDMDMDMDMDIREYYYTDSEFFVFFRGEDAEARWLRVSAAYLTLREMSPRLRRLGCAWINADEELDMARCVDPVPLEFFRDPPEDLHQLREWAERLCHHTKTVIITNFKIANCLANQIRSPLPQSLVDQLKNDVPPDPIRNVGNFLAAADPPHRGLTQLFGEPTDMASAWSEILERPSRTEKSNE